MARIAALLEQKRPLVMGILNVTPDSFSDGGEFFSLSQAIDHALCMEESGADIIDIGGESTRPGASSISETEELSRVIPVIEQLRSVSDIPISVDTSKSKVMKEALSCDIDLINDVTGLQDLGAMEVLAGSDAYVCLVHMKGTPQNMQANPFYDDLIGDIKDFFWDRIRTCQKKGITLDRLIIDVGFGFGKTPEHNLKLINRLEGFGEFRLPLMVGISRKNTIKKITEDVLPGSIAAGLAALKNGAKILRVHDVGEALAAVKVWESISREMLLDWRKVL